MLNEKNINVKEDEQEINLYHSCAFMNYIFNETAVENPMHCIFRDSHILKCVYYAYE